MIQGSDRYMIYNIIYIYGLYYIIYFYIVFMLLWYYDIMFICYGLWYLMTNDKKNDYVMTYYLV